MTPTPTRAAIASLVTGGFLLLLKAYAAWATASIAMLGSLADTALDIVASLVILWSIRVAAAPADREHRFGHGKAEALAALFQVALISVSAAAIGWRAAEALATDTATANATDGIVVSLVAIGVTLALVAFQRRALARTNSIAVRADTVHYQSDLLLNLAVIAALGLDQYLGLRHADAAFGVVIALWLLRSAWRTATTAIDQLMDKEWPDAKRARFLAVAATHPELAGIHDLRTRTSGAIDFVQFHVWVDGDMKVAEAHRVMDEIEARLAREFPDVEILIHPDPAGHVDAVGRLPSQIAKETTL